jgi:phosphoglycolate phosphatase
VNISRLHQRTIDAVIWDFNGTILDDIDLVVRTVNGQLAKRSLASLTIAEYRDVFGFPVEDYYRRIGVTFEDESMAQLSADFFAEYEPQLVHCSLHDGILDALVQFRNAGRRQFVLSAMEEELLRRTIERLGISGFFDAIYGLAHLEADSKISRGRELLADHRIRSKTALLIGDTDHDAEVAVELGMSAILVAQGHQSETRLQEMGCPVYRDVSALVRATL